MNYKILREFLTYKAKENYVCDHCSETIFKGDTYAREYVTNVRTTPVKLHPNCYSKRLNEELIEIFDGHLFDHQSRFRWQSKTRIMRLLG
jgi:hypothetical protein